MSAENKNFVVYGSSAGSGKTYTLVKEYLKLILRSDYSGAYKKVLAITFTNAAAAEMKERVLKQLKEFSIGQGSMFYDLSQEMELEKDVLSKRADRVFKDILHHYSDIHISTIDSFVHGIIRSFARDLQLDPEFEIELDGERVLEESIDQIFERVGNDKELTELLLRYIRSQIDDEKTWDVRTALLSFGRLILKEESSKELEKLSELTFEDFKLLSNKIGKKISGFEKKVQDMARDSLLFIENQGIEHSDFSGAYFPKYLLRLKDFKNGGPYKNLIPGKSILSVVDDPNKNYYPAKVDAATKQSIDNIKEDLNGIIKFFLDLSESEEIAEYNTLLKIRSNIYNLSLLNEIEKESKLWKEEHKTLLISDFNDMINKIVLNNPAPYIYEKIGERFNHILIDEFQDTSTKQWSNFLPLIENSLAKNQFNLIVGDAKQAIYRWRNGDVMQFVNLPKIDPKSGRHISQHLFDANHKKEVLRDNYRSTSEVVEFNNTLYKALSEKEGISKVYEDLKQNPKRKSKGYVKVEPFIKNDETDFRSDILNQIEETIRISTDLGYQAKDIGILVRKKKHGQEIAEHLIENGISVLSSESLKVDSDPGVQILSGFLEYLLNSDHQEAKVKIFRGLKLLNEEFDLTAMLLKYKVKKGKVYTIDFEAFLENHFPEISKSKILTRGIYSIVEFLMNQFKLNEKSNLFLETYLDFVYDLSEKKKMNLGDVVKTWNRKKEKLFLQSNYSNDSVNVMTVHNSKGLQFPVVIYPIYFSEKSPSKIIWLKEGKESSGLPAAAIEYRKPGQAPMSGEFYDEENLDVIDNLNIHYVATTRAEDHLYVFPAGNIPAQGKSNDLTEFLDIVNVEFEDYRIDDIIEIGSREEADNSEEESQEKNVVELNSYNLFEQFDLSLGAPREWNIADNEKDYGLIIHEILSGANTYEDALDRLTRKEVSGQINSEFGFNLRKDLKRFFEWESIQKWFDENISSKNEKGIIDQEGKLHIPDKVVYFEDRIELIDFKTGSEEEKHKKQILRYKDLIESIEDRPIEAFLVYIKNQRIVPVN